MTSTLFNRTLSTTFPDHAVLIADGGEPEGEIIKILRRAAQAGRHRRRSARSHE